MAQLNKSNINSIFFEVVERNVYWDKVNGGLFQEDKYEYTPKYKAIVDKDRETLLKEKEMLDIILNKING